MSVKVKGGMRCDRCKKPVAAVRNGHAVRNTASVFGAVPTAGLSLLATKSERWVCPDCGGAVRQANLSIKGEWVAALIIVQLIVGSVVAAAAQAFVWFLVVLLVPWLIYFATKKLLSA